MTTQHLTNHSFFLEGAHPWEPLQKLEALEVKGAIHCPIPEGVHLVNRDQIFIGEGTTIEPGAFIKGPCIIGKNCDIRHGAYIRGPVVIGDGCVIGHCTEVKGSILHEGVSAGHFNYIGDSILKKGVLLGAGAKLANLRFDQKEVSVLLDGKEVPTGRKKLGAIIGEGAQVGCNVVLTPGSLIAKGAICPPTKSRTRNKG